MGKDLIEHLARDGRNQPDPDKAKELFHAAHPLTPRPPAGGLADSHYGRAASAGVAAGTASWARMVLERETWKMAAHACHSIF